jgi:hypothetical protein
MCRWSDGEARGIVASVRHAGAWRQVVIPGVSKCSGGAFTRATDAASEFVASLTP